MPGDLGRRSQDVLVPIGPAFVTPGSTWQNGFAESFNGTLSVELLNREWFGSRAEANVFIEQWPLITESSAGSLCQPSDPASVYRLCESLEPADC
ncbi:Integrase core domain-containing protein [Paraburkholderia susongensis]|uniref:Integrase core domain-containing protein n=1 Tax=Paraburkholderia susongensis TaxID=1515439 RepID=A0A1X7M1K1_9BURK|nr:Integrase core domain-containing protein [Paraburkholderia susongensis]